MMRYEDASTWCLLHEVELTTDMSPLGGELLTLAGGGYKLTTVVPADDWEDWRDAVVLLVEQLRSRLAT
jgi:hypothetical protein